MKIDHREFCLRSLRGSLLAAWSLIGGRVVRPSRTGAAQAPPDLAAVKAPPPIVVTPHLESRGGDTGPYGYG